LDTNVPLRLPAGIVGCRSQLHGEIKEIFRLTIEESVGHEGLDGCDGTA
jgi:hypothetical protein